jgi:hypothetical protein
LAPLTPRCFGGGAKVVSKILKAAIMPVKLSKNTTNPLIFQRNERRDRKAGGAAMIGTSHEQ